MTPDDNSREMGVEFGDVADAIESPTYPVSNSDFLADLGDSQVRLPDGSATLRELLEPLGETTYESPQDVRQAVFDMVGADAVGREEYSDRGTVTGRDSADEESL